MSDVVPWSSWERTPYPVYTEEIREHWAESHEKIIVLDDDPTGCQSVHDIPIYFQWDYETLLKALQTDDKLIFILTNIRSQAPAQAEALHRTIATLLADISRELGITLRVISRSDSTLRGHFPEDLRPFFTSAHVDGVVFVPAFFDGGRFTFHGTHYVKTKDGVVPAHETEFANDNAFGFSTAYLPQWIRNKWPGSRLEVRMLTIETIRDEGVDGIARVLATLRDKHVLAVDALDEGDLSALSLAVIRRQRAGQNFLFRSAASFIQAYAGITKQNILNAHQILGDRKSGGLVVVGSHVRKTSDQLTLLLCLDNIVGIELNVEDMLRGSNESVARNAASQIDENLRRGKDVICYTSRELIHGASTVENLTIGRKVSDTIIQIVRQMTVAPSFLIVKGGITSHVIAERGLGVKNAWVLGQAHAGVPVWETDRYSKWPCLHYVVFPGNVGDEETLAELVRSFQQYRFG